MLSRPRSQEGAQACAERPWGASGATLRVPSLTSVHGSFAAVPILQMRRQRLGRDVAWQRQTAHGEWGSVVPTPPQGGPPELLLPKTLFSFFLLFSFRRSGSSLLRGLPSGCGKQGLPSGCHVWAFHCSALWLPSSGCSTCAQ